MSVAAQYFYSAATNGPAAVIVFFVLSGFCIHYPFRGARPAPPLLSFWARRLLRLGLPALAALCLSRLIGVKLGEMLRGMFWSLICEALYYGLYPGLRWLAPRMGWTALTSAAFVAAAALALANPQARMYIDLGDQLTWLLGLPMFLLGCGLAERAERADSLTQAVPLVRRWGMRLLVWGLAGFCVYLRHWSVWHVGYPLLLNLFGLVVVPWLAGEIAHFRHASPWPWLERAGKASYSLYLVHLFAMGTMAGLGIVLAGELPVRLAGLTTALVLAGVFYLCIERPSHQLVRRIFRSEN